MASMVKLGSDPNAKAKTQVLRLPGTFHNKGEPFEVTWERGATEECPPDTDGVVPLCADGTPMRRARRYLPGELIAAFAPDALVDSSPDARQPSTAVARTRAPEPLDGERDLVLATFALKHIDPEPRQRTKDGSVGWVEVMMGLHPYGQAGYEVLDAWAQQSAKYDAARQRYEWDKIKDDRANGIKIGSLFSAAKTHGWDGAAVTADGEVIHLRRRANARDELGDIANGDDAITWPYVTGKDMKVNAKHIGNTIKLLEHKGWRVRRNEFACCDEVDRGYGFVPLDDITVLQLHAYAGTHGFHPEEKMFRNYLKVLASRELCHPVREYLEGLKWDGTPRLDKWTCTYLGAEDTPLHRAFGRVLLLGAVHRVMSPGCQYDYIVVLEGLQDAGKSSAVRVLGDPWFTDALKLGSDGKLTIEQTIGSWIVEAAELAGMEKREVEAIKAQVTCRQDRARLAYGHYTSTIPRQWIVVGTTNDSTYLRDRTGNRRFLPIATSTIDLGGLRRDRDQLWAEAFHYADAGELAMLPRELRAAAAEAQAARVALDAISERLRELLADVASGYLVKEDVWRALDLNEPRSRTPFTRSVKDTMRELGWAQKQLTPPSTGKRAEVYERVIAGETPEWWQLNGGRFISAAENDELNHEMLS